MDIVTGNNGQGAMLFSTASMEEGRARASEEERNMEEDSKAGTTSKSADSLSKEDVLEVLRLTARMEKATTSLQLGLEEEASEGSYFSEDDLSVRSGDLDLQLSDYDSNAQEVSSGEFDARHVKKYAKPKSFKHVLWNTVGPSAGAMRICLEIIKEELSGQIAGVPAEFKDLPEQLISFMYKEAGEDIHDAITCINRMHKQLGKYDDDDEEEGNSDSHVKTITYDEIEPAPDIPLTEDRGPQEASTTQGPLPGAQQTSPADGTFIEPATEAGGDKEGVLSVSMAEGG
jgi:hypothetical protein